VKVLFLMSMSGGAHQAAGRDTAADGIIRLAGGVNAIGVPPQPTTVPSLFNASR